MDNVANSIIDLFRIFNSVLLHSITNDFNCRIFLESSESSRSCLPMTLGRQVSRTLGHRLLLRGEEQVFLPSQVVGESPLFVTAVKVQVNHILVIKLYKKYVFV